MIRFGGGALIYYWFLKRGTYTKQGAYLRTENLILFERPHVKQSFDAYMTEVQKDWKRDLSLDLFFLND